MFGKINACATVFLKQNCGEMDVHKKVVLMVVEGLSCYFFSFWHFTPPGDLKSEEPANKEAGDEKAEEDNDYHRSDEQVGFPVPIWPH